MGYTEYRHWSQVLGCEAVRLSVFDRNGDEFFCIIPIDGPGRRYREARDAALDQIIDVMRDGREPGEVHV